MRKRGNQFDVPALGAFQTSYAIPGIRVYGYIQIHGAIVAASLASIAPFLDVEVEYAEPVENGQNGPHGADPFTERPPS
jgi:hypothetical protein